MNELSEPKPCPVCGQVGPHIITLCWRPRWQRRLHTPLAMWRVWKKTHSLAIVWHMGVLWWRHNPST